MIDPATLILGVASAASSPTIPPPQGPNRGPLEGVVEPAMPPPTDPVDEPTASTSILPDGLSIDLSATWTSAYVFRGYVQEDRGFIFQPAVTLGWAIADETADAPGIGVYFTNWNSIHGVDSSAQRSPRSWYEADYIVGAALGWRGWTLDAAVSWYTSPSDAFDTTCELDVLVAHDLPDDTWYGAVLGDPYALLAVELDNRNVGSNRSGNTYLELGAGPSFDVTDDVGVSVPVSVGLGLRDYYIDSDGDSEFFGFVSVTPTVSWAIAEGDFGALSLDAGVSIQFLGNAARASNDGDDTLVVGFVGLGWSF